MAHSQKARDIANVLEKAEYPVKFLKPKILLVDMPGTCVDVLRRTGYNVTEGTFGKPYLVEASNGFFPVPDDSKLPNCSEQEIVIVNADRPTALNIHHLGCPVMVSIVTGKMPNWALSIRGCLPWSMRAGVLGDISGFGGIFLVFVPARFNINYVWGNRKQYIGLDEKAELYCWSGES